MPVTSIADAKRDREWWEAICGVETIAHTPAAVKAWLMDKLLTAVVGRAGLERKHLEQAKKRIGELERVLERCLEGAPHGWDPKALKPVLMMCRCRWCHARRVLAEFVDPRDPMPAAWRRQEG